MKDLQIGVFGPEGNEESAEKGKMFYSGFGPLEIYEYGRFD